VKPRLALLCALGLLAAPALADRVLTADGRVLAPKKAREQGAGYKFTFENGELVIPDKKAVQSVEIEGDMSEYVPKNDDEKKKLADGFVKYKGKWFSKPAYEGELKREHDLSHARTQELAAHADWSNAWTRETPHFLFKSNTSPEVLDYYCELLEAYYNLMDQRIGINPTPVMRRTKMTINIYKNYDEFLELSDSRAGVGPGVLGYFWSYNKTLNFFHDYSEPSLSTWVALHECTHLLTYLIDQQYEPQIWLNEAVADYFGSSKVERDKNGKLTIKPGELQTDRVLTVQEAIKVEKEGGVKTGEGSGADGKPAKGKHSRAGGRPFTHLSELFILNHDEFDGFQYAHAWAFVYFLNNFENGKYQKAFNKFFKGLYTLEKGLDVESVPGGGITGAGKAVSPENIRKFLFARLGLKDKDQEQLEKDWRTYIENIPILGPEARLKRGLYGMRMGEFDEALADLDAAIAGGTTDPRAYWARGKCAMFGKGPKAGIADLQKAIELEPLNELFHYDLSCALVGFVSNGGRFGKRGGGFTPGEGDGAKIDNPEARKEAGLAMELAPDNDLYRQWFERFQ
jgi:tetratricopeptide (TPR) repeat protein